MIKLYTKKLTSLNPTQWKYIEIEKATELYAYYIQMCGRYEFDDQKSFEKWLKTEI